MRALRIVCCLVIGATAGSVTFDSMYLYGGHVVVGILIIASFLGYVASLALEE